MNRYAGYAVVACLALIVGYFAGREHLKYEMRSAIESAAEGFKESFSSVFGDGTSADKSDNEKEINRVRNAEAESAAKAEYIANSLQLYDITAKYMDSVLDGRLPGVLFKIRNVGNRQLDRVEVTVYFKDNNGNVIAEEDFVPVSEYSLSGAGPLKPNYIWQMERSKFYSAKNVPTEWREGNVEAKITDIEFSSDESGNGESSG